MGWFKKANKMVDERITLLQNKIYREMYILVMVLCLASIVVKQIIYGSGIEHVITEFVILLLQVIYYLVRSAGLGIFSDEIEVHDRTNKISMSKKNVYTALGFAIITAVLVTLTNAKEYGDGTAESFFNSGMVFVASLLVNLPIFILLIGGVYYVAKRASIRATKKDND